MKSFIQKLIKIPIRESINQHLDRIDSLNDFDNLAALEKITQYLSTFSTNTSIPDELRLELLSNIDERYRERIQHTISHYAKFDKLNPNIESRLYEVAFYYCRQLFLNYQNLIDSYANTFDSSKLSINGQNLQMIIGRSINAAAAMLKLRYFNHLATPSAIWLQIYHQFGIAEQRNLVNQPVQIYNNRDSATLSAIFVQACMMDSLNKTSMNRQHIELISDLLIKLVHKIKVAQIYDENKHLFFIDLSKDVGAKRIRGYHPSPTHRYWEIDSLSIKIELILYALKNNKPLTSFNLGSLSDDPSFEESINYLHTEWSRPGYKRQRRKEPRKKIKQTAKVAYGIEMLCEQISSYKGSPLSSFETQKAQIFEERLAAHKVSNLSKTILLPYKTEGEWTITDESTQGYGALVSRDNGFVAKPNKIVGLVFEQNENIVIGVIKSVAGLPNNEKHIGIQVLSRKSEWIRMVKIDQQLPDNVTQSVSIKPNFGFSGIYLPPQEGLNELASIILPKFNFRENSTYEVSLLDKKFVIRVENAAEAKDDWVRISFKGEF